MKGEKLYGFSVKMATEAEIPEIQDITKDAFLRYVREAHLDNIEALNETYEDINLLNGKMCEKFTNLLLYLIIKRCRVKK